MIKKTKQTDMILDYMKVYKSITPLEAMRDIGVMRLSARIYDLKKDGWVIIKSTITAKNRWGDNVKFAKYSISNPTYQGRIVK